MPLLRQLYWLPVHYRINYNIQDIADNFQSHPWLVTEYTSSPVSIQSRGRYNLRGQKVALLSGLRR